MALSPRERPPRPGGPARAGEHVELPALTPPARQQFPRSLPKMDFKRGTIFDTCLTQVSHLGVLGVFHGPQGSFLLVISFLLPALETTPTEHSQAHHLWTALHRTRTGRVPRDTDLLARSLGPTADRVSRVRREEPLHPLVFNTSYHSPQTKELKGPHTGPPAKRNTTQQEANLPGSFHRAKKSGHLGAGGGSSSHPP